MLRDARYTEKLKAQARRASSDIPDAEEDGTNDDGPVVVWSSPIEGQMLSPGDTLVGTWSSDEDIPSPLFSLCVSAQQDDSDSNDSGCGESIYTHVRETSTGSSTMSLTVPQLNAAGQFYLVMEDDDGYEYKSPVFSLLPAATAISALPTASSLSTVSGDITSSSSLPYGASGIPTAVNYANQSQPSTLALAIPLSLIGAIMLIALGMCCCKWRRSVRKRQKAPHAFVQTTSTYPYPFGGCGTSTTSPRQQAFTKDVSELSAAQLCSAPSRNPFLASHMSQLEHGRSTIPEDKYTEYRERSRRVSGYPSVRRDDSNTPPMAPRLPSQEVRSLRSGLSFESFPSDHIDYGMPLTSAPQPPRRSRDAKGSERVKRNGDRPFLTRPLSHDKYHNEESETDAMDDDDTSIPPSSTLAPGLPPRVVYRARSRPLSGDAMVYRLSAHDDARGEGARDIYRAVSQAIRMRSTV